MRALEINVRGLKEFQRAIKANPKVVREESGKFMARANAEYMRTILRDPWKIGEKGGGAPLDTGHLRDTHRKIIKDFHMIIRPEPTRVKPNYADYVHEGTWKMQDRPWLDYAIDRNKDKVDQLLENMLSNITNSLAN